MAVPACVHACACETPPPQTPGPFHITVEQFDFGQKKKKKDKEVTITFVKGIKSGFEKYFAYLFPNSCHTDWQDHGAGRQTVRNAIHFLRQR